MGRSKRACSFQDVAAARDILHTTRSQQQLFMLLQIVYPKGKGSDQVRTQELVGSMKAIREAQTVHVSNFLRQGRQSTLVYHDCIILREQLYHIAQARAAIAFNILQRLWLLEPNSLCFVDCTRVLSRSNMVSGRASSLFRNSLTFTTFPRFHSPRIVPLTTLCTLNRSACSV